VATPTAFTADILKDMLKQLEYYQPRESLLMSSGYKREAMKTIPNAAPSYENPILNGYTTTYLGLPIETIDIPPEEVIDWSGCRSPSRAKRRHARGIPQRVKVTYRERAFLFDKRALGDIRRRFDRMVVKMLYGG
jgi:hypothetical protein